MPKTPLSASRIKTLQSCSWEFWASYYLQVPNVDNTGSILGSLSHACFEYLGEPKRRAYFDKLIETQKLKSVPSIYRYCLTFLRSKKLDPFANTVSAQGEEISHIDLVERMVMAGLNYDFFGQDRKPDEVHSEIDFDIDVEEDGKSYRIRGFIDKLILFKENSLAVIRDWKSSKQVYSGDEIHDNIQDLSYRLAVSKKFPEYKKKQTEFSFLQHNPSKDAEFSQFILTDKGKDIKKFKAKHLGGGRVFTPIACDDELDGFEHFLTDIQEIVENFDEEVAKSNMAKDKGFTEDFGGLTKCGARVEYPGQMKKDGTKASWFCPSHFGYYFYSIVKDGKILESKMEEKDLRGLKEGEEIEKRFYKGCWAWKDQKYNREINEEAKKLGFKDVFEEEKEVDDDWDM